MMNNEFQRDVQKQLSQLVDATEDGSDRIADGMHAIADAIERYVDEQKEMRTTWEVRMKIFTDGIDEIGSAIRRIDREFQIQREKEDGLL